MEKELRQGRSIQKEQNSHNEETTIEEPRVVVESEETGLDLQRAVDFTVSLEDGRLAIEENGRMVDCGVLEFDD